MIILRLCAGVYLRELLKTTQARAWI
jgi:hypothetical protein